jgi:orotate phosphoribosyltransferase
MIERLNTVKDVGELLSVDGPPQVRDRVLSIVATAEAILKGHFLLQAGEHSGYLLRFRQIGRDPEVAKELGQLLVPDYATISNAAVICPESSGFFLGRAVAELTKGALTVAKIDHSRRPTNSIRSGDVPSRGSRVLIVNDVATSASSLEPLIQLARGSGGVPERIVVFGTLKPARLQKTANDQSVTESHLVSALWPTFPADSCPLCKEGSEALPAAEFN